MERLLFERGPERSPICLYGETPEITSLRPPERLGGALRHELPGHQTGYYLVLGHTMYPAWFDPSGLLGLSIRVGSHSAVLRYFVYGVWTTYRGPHDMMIMDPTWFTAEVHYDPPGGRPRAERGEEGVAHGTLIV